MRPRQPIFRAPAVVLWLIAAAGRAPMWRGPLSPPELSIAWINAVCLHPGALQPRLPGQPGSIRQPRGQRALPFVSYMGLHNDYTHLAINCLWLLAFGPIVARRFGAVLFLVFFIVCGVAGAATHLAFNWGSPDAGDRRIGRDLRPDGGGHRLLPTQAALGAMSPAKPPLLPLFSRQILLFTLVWVVLNVVAGLTGLGMAGEAG